MFGKFKEFIVKKEIKIDEEQFAKDEFFNKIRLKSYIARSFWTDEGWYTITQNIDTQLKKAVTLFPEAEKIAGLVVQKSKSKN